MAEPIKFPEANVTFTADGCEDLPVCKTEDTAGQSLLISRWKLTPDELAEAQRTGCVYLMVVGQNQPPVCVMAHSPFMVTAKDN